MTAQTAPRSIDQYLRQLREALAGEDNALVQDALYDAEEYLRAELAAARTLTPPQSEADVLERIASTYGAPEEVAAAYRTTEAKVTAALRLPPPVPRPPCGPSCCRPPAQLRSSRWRKGRWIWRRLRCCRGLSSAAATRALRSLGAGNARRPWILLTATSR